MFPSKGDRKKGNLRDFICDAFGSRKASKVSSVLLNKGFNIIWKLFLYTLYIIVHFDNSRDFVLNLQVKFWSCSIDRFIDGVVQTENCLL